MTKVKTGFEQIHFVNDYRDEPRSGVADFNGKPHWFENIFDETLDDYSPFYWLTPLSSSAFDFVKQQSEIFSRWRQAFDKGEVDISTHPALPQDAEKYKKTAGIINGEVAAQEKQRIKVHGEMKRVDDGAPAGTLSVFQVKWDLES